MSVGADPEGGRLNDAIKAELDYDIEPLTVTVVAELPMTATGKIVKGELSARALAMSLDG